MYVYSIITYCLALNFFSFPWSIRLKKKKKRINFFHPIDYICLLLSPFLGWSCCGWFWSLLQLLQSSVSSVILKIFFLFSVYSKYAQIYELQAILYLNMGVCIPFRTIGMEHFAYVKIPVVFLLQQIVTL